MLIVASFNPSTTQYKEINVYKVLFLILLTSISGCAFVGGSAGVNWSAMNPGPLPDNDTARLKAESAIKYVLKDPDSAKFRSSTPFFKTLYNYGLAGVGNNEALWAMCIEVNAKNSYGGYNGYKWYYVKFRNGEPVNDSLGVGEGHYDCTKGPADPSRRSYQN